MGLNGIDNFYPKTIHLFRFGRTYFMLSTLNYTSASFKPSNLKCCHLMEGGRNHKIAQREWLEQTCRAVIKYDKFPAMQSCKSFSEKSKQILKRPFFLLRFSI